MFSRDRVRVSFMLLVVLFSTPLQSIAQQLTASIEWIPQPTQVPATVAPVIRDDVGATLSPQIQGDQWEFTFGETTSLYRVFLIALSGMIPSDYGFREIQLELPFYSQRNMATVLAPTRIDSGATAVRALFARKVPAMSVGTLQTSYQEARAIAFTRMERLQRKWTLLHDYDVQAVYKFLEITVTLAKKTDFTGLQEDMDSAREWLTDAIQNQDRRVTHAMGGSLRLANDALREIVSIKGRRFGSLWKNILAETDPTQRCSLLDEYDKLLVQMPRQEYADVTAVSGVLSSLVLSAQAQCLVQIQKSGNVQPVNAITWQGALRRMKDLVERADEANRRRLQSDISVLEEFFGKRPN